MNLTFAWKGLRRCVLTGHGVVAALMLGQPGEIAAAEKADTAASGWRKSSGATPARPVESGRSQVDADVIQLVQHVQPSSDSNQTELQRELDQLKDERNSLVTVRDSAVREPASTTDSVAEQREALKRQLHDLVTELTRRPQPEPKPAVSTANGSKKQPGPRRTEQSKRDPASSSNDAVKPSHGALTVATPGPVDSMALAQALFRTADYDGALKAFRLAEKTEANPQDRIAIKYFTAACLGKLGNKQESTVLFREVANSKVDDLFAECARWQLSAQQWREGIEARIEQLRAAGIATKRDSSETDPVPEQRSTGSPLAPREQSGDAAAP